MKVSSNNLTESQNELLKLKKDDTLNDINFLENLTKLEQNSLQTLLNDLAALNSQVGVITSNIKSIRPQLDLLDQLDNSAEQISDKACRLQQLVEMLRIKVSAIY